MERKLASVQIIAEKKPIKGADLIEAIRINGWWLVSKKGEFEVGDKCVYFEVDSFLPIKPEFEFLRKNSYRSNPDIGEGFKLRTIKLKGQISQGLALPMKSLPAIEDYILSIRPFSFGFYDSRFEPGADFTEILGVRKWELPEKGNFVGQQKGSFPSFIRKTDQERCQNLVNEIYEAYHAHEVFEITTKLDGSSCTAYYYNGEVGVCSRNIELKLNEENKDNHFVKTITKLGILDKLKELGRNIAIQGELMGPGIQGNELKLTEHNFYVFDIFDIDKQEYLTPYDRIALLELFLEVKHIPVLEKAKLPLPNSPYGYLPYDNIEDLLELADELSNTEGRIVEGFVCKSLERNFSFKVISNSYLLGEK